MVTELEALRKKCLLTDRKITELTRRVAYIESEMDIQPSNSIAETQKSVQATAPAVEKASSKRENPTSLFRIFGIIGAVMIILGIVYFYKYAVDKEWIGITGRVAIGILAGLMLVGVGVLFHKRDYRNYAQVINAIGFGVLYFTIFATYHFEAYRQALGMTLILNTILLLAIMGGGVFLGIVMSSRFLVYGSFFFSYVSAFLSGIEGRTLQILIFVLIIDLFVLIMAKQRAWYMGIPAQVMTYIAYMIWFIQGIFNPGSILSQTSYPVLLTFSFLLGYYIIFTLLSFTQESKAKEGEGIALCILNTVALAGFGAGVIVKYADELNGLYLIALAGLTIFIGSIARKRKYENLFDIYFLCTVALVAIAIPVQFDKTIVTVLWVLSALGLAYAGARIKHTRLFYLGYAGYLIPLLRVLFFDLFFLSDIVERFLAVGSCLAGLIIMQFYILSHCTREEIEKDVLFTIYSIVIAVLLAIWIGIEAYRLSWFDGIERMSHSIGWALLSITFIAYGVFNERKVYNWCGIVLFGIVILKIIFVDIWVLQNIVRVFVLILVGILALVGSFVFVKNRDKIKEYI